MYHPLSLAAVSFHFTQNLNIEYRRLLACEERERERQYPSLHYIPRSISSPTSPWTTVASQLLPLATLQHTVQLGHL